MHRATSGRQCRSFLLAEFQTSALEGSKATLDDRHDDHFLPAAVAVKLRTRDQGQHQARVSASPPPSQRRRVAHTHHPHVVREDTCLRIKGERHENRNDARMGYIINGAQG